MPRRYAPDGRPLIYGKLPEDLTENEMRQFLADTKNQLNRKDFLTMATKATNTKTATQTAPADMDTRAEQDAEAYLLFDAPIAELAESLKVDIDEAVRLRVEAALGAAPIKLEATVRPIEPRGKMIGFASINFGGAITLHDFRIFNGEKGLFVTPPSVKDSTTRSGYRDTARLMGDDIKNQLNVVVRDAYVAEVEKLQARAAAVLNTPDKPRIKDQLEKAGQEAARDNAARPIDTTERTPPPAHDDR